MRSFYSLTLLSLMAFSLHAEEVITEKDQFIDAKTGRYVRVCEQVNGELIVKEACGKYWDKYKRKREELIKEVKSYKEIESRSMVMIPVKDREGNVKMVLGRVSFLYENGRIDVMEYYSQRFGFTPGTSTWNIKYDYITKLKKDHPLLKHSEMCAKEDTEIVYNFDDKRSFSLKKGEKVILKGIFENNMAAISLHHLGSNFLGYGLDNQIPVALSKLEVCEDDKTEAAINDSSRIIPKEQVVAPESHEEGTSSSQSK